MFDEDFQFVKGGKLLGLGPERHITGGRPIIPEGSTIIEADDEVFFIAARADIRAVMSELRRLEQGYKRIIIAGAAGRDFHDFNTFFRDNPSYEVVAFTATQIPNIEGRVYCAC